LNCSPPFSLNSITDLLARICRLVSDTC
jgi:hypothetical protein